jgi:peptide/nickel transport system permease protein
MPFLVRRLGFFVLTLWATLTVNFFLPRLMPGNPAQAMMSRIKGGINPQSIKALEVAFGVNTTESLPVQYVHYLANVAQGNLGISFAYYPNQVSHQILQALPYTLGLIGITTIIAFILGTFAGMISAWWRGGIADSLLPSVFVVVSAFPYFWLGLISIYVFSVILGWFPMGFAVDVGVVPSLSWAFVGQLLYHALLPALTILITSIGGWILTMRNNMISTLAEDYVRMARAKGLSTMRIMIVYAGRNAILPNITGFAMSLGFVLSGALLVEIVFTYPGIGDLLYQAVVNEDYPLMQGLFLLITVAVLVAVLASDLANALLDPRTRERA